MRKVAGFLAIIAVAGAMACGSDEAADQPMEGEMDQPEMQEATDSMPADTVMARDTAAMEEEM